MTGTANVLEHASVVMRNGRIVAVGPTTSTQVPAGAARIDGRGKFVIPGLADMHAHLYADEWVPDSVGAVELGVFLANGVTTARLMIGTPLHHKLRRALQDGRLFGPQLWIASPELNGGSTAHSRTVRSATEARAVVNSVADSAYDFVKLTTDITPEVYDAVIDQAAQRKIPVVGHVDPG